MYSQEVRPMTAQLRNETHKEYSYIDEHGNYCEVWGSDDDYAEWPDSLEGWADFFEGLMQ